MPSDLANAADPFEEGLAGDLPRGLPDRVDAPVASRWVRPSELQNSQKWHWQPGSYFLGYRGNQVVGRRDDRHLLLVAGSRAGKGVSILLPNCLLWPGSMLAIDPKGELARKTAGHRKSAQEVFILNPLRLDGLPEHTFNPLAEIPLNASDTLDRVALIADALIIHEGSGETHWTDAARQLVKGVILYTLTLPDAERNLVTVRELLTLRSPRIPPPEEGVALFAELINLLLDREPDDGIEDVIRGIGLSFAGKPRNEAASILSTAQTQTDFLDSGGLANSLRGGPGSLKLADLKRRLVTVYLCLPASHMGTHARWLRMVINLALAALEKTEAPKGAEPVLLVLEEFNVLGHMASIATAAGQIAGFGVRLLTVLQDLTQLQNHYKAAWETFIGNAGLVLAFGNADATTLEFLSKKLGQISIAVESKNNVSAQASLGGASGLSYNTQTIPLLAPQEVEQVFARERERLLVLYPGNKPIVVRRSISHDDPRFKPLLNLPL